MADQAFFDAVDARGRRAGRRSVREGCLAMPDPSRSTMFDHVYVEEHPLVEAERAEFAAYHAELRGERH